MEDGNRIAADVHCTVVEFWQKKWLEWKISGLGL